MLGFVGIVREYSKDPIESEPFGVAVELPVAVVQFAGGPACGSWASLHPYCGHQAVHMD